MSPVSITLIGGPTALIEIGGFRLLTDPTFDQPGDYRLPYATLTKTSTPALTPNDIGTVDAVLLFAGAAQTRGPFNLTMNTNDAIETARAFPNAVIVPIHTEGWRHFSQGPRDLEISFKALGVGSRLRLPKPGVAMAIDLG
jgi:L-ascorbate metabolism protein UlaG (beta-lactamase superfamily)